MIDRGTFRIDLPKIDYMEQQNTFTGSIGRFRYKFYPESSGDAKVLTVGVYADHCYEIEDEAGRITRESFEWSNDGVAAAEEWICSQYEAFVASGK